ncbi:DUF2975 domain-containing protein [Fictibacillus aquaticus]|uniref:DUF2975 domain-containing protein n=1 Tax=Fictibacillus aquaticus TaxID=2021314 RepID=A0A235F955_9BACL|nr:DUF2975 domain-containing protein [Fictibacillus aquaticus]OYD57235.1 hypothetical protein CGZ90_11130 [Fictibacillus aquaticus]
MTNLFKVLSKISIILFYVLSAFGMLIIVLDSFRVFAPDSAITKSLGEVEPIFSYLNLNFHEQPAVYSQKSFLMLSLVSTITTFAVVVLFLWFMHKLLKNIHTDSLFMIENVSILMKMGLTIMIIGAASSLIEGILINRSLSDVQIANATISYSNIQFADYVINGIVLIIFSLALKKAVIAVEENKHTI